MNQLIETLNRAGEWVIGLAPGIVLQTSLLVLVVLASDLLLRRRLRASVRYGLWLLVLLKLCLPPSLALPTGIGWWVRFKPPEPAEQQVALVKASYETPGAVAPAPEGTPQSPSLPQPTLSVRAWELLVWAVGMVGLLAVMIVRCLGIARLASGGTPPDVWVMQLMNDLAASHRIFRLPRVQVIDRDMSPALFGLLRPTILLPRSILTELNPSQVRMVLLHEMTHLRRGDLWVNCAQSLLQVLYWWHPLVWYANARLRHLREEAVDEAVLREVDSAPQNYAATLLKVAGIAIKSPRPTLGLVGILEPTSALSRRIHRIVNGNARAKKGLTVLSIAGIAALGAVAIPMGERPVSTLVPQAGIMDRPGIVRRSETSKETSPDSSVLGLVGQQSLTSRQASTTERLIEPAASQTQTAPLKEPDPSAPSQPAERQNSNSVTVSENPSFKSTERYKMPYTGRRAILVKLLAIRLDKVEFDNQRLDDVVLALSDLAKKNDPDGKGIEFFLDQTRPPQADGLPAIPEIGSVTIRIRPALVDVRLSDLLDAIVKVADTKIKYAIEDSGVAFAFKGKDSPPRYTRVFKVDPNAFAQLLNHINPQPNASGPAVGVDSTGTNTFNSTRGDVRGFLSSCGFSAEPPNSVFYTQREGTLLVHATLPELDRIESALSAPASEIPALSSRAEGASKAAAQPKTSAPSQQPKIRIHATFVELPEQALRSRHLALPTGSTPRVWDPSELDALKKIKGVEVLSAQSVTTYSGLQAQIQATEMKTVVNGIKLPVPAGLGVSDRSPTNSALTPTYLTEAIPFGPGLDVRPVLGEDGKTIELDLVAKVTEFLGYDDDQRARGSDFRVPLPHFRINSITTRGKVSDGQCLLLPPLKATDLSAKSDARSELKPGRNPKAIIVFVAATLDPESGSKEQ